FFLPFFFFFRPFIAAPSASPGVIAQGLHSLDQHHWPTPSGSPHDNRGHRKTHACLGRLCSRLTGNSTPRNPKICAGRRAGWRKNEHSIAQSLRLFVLGQNGDPPPPAQAPYFCTIRTLRSPQAAAV